jgi:hypothetical protein
VPMASKATPRWIGTARAGWLGAALFAACASPAYAQVNWQFLGSETEPSPSSESAGLSQKAVAPQALQASTSPCGEPARPATEPYRSIVARLVEVCGVNAQVYESRERTSPHARAGGCIFYNRDELGSLFDRWLNLTQPSLAEPMLYAIFAHELGHLAHRDFSEERAALEPMRRELEADRFAGYTLSRLNIRVDDLTEYYRLTGDDFTGIRHDHGSSGQRAQAFMLGWRRAELGLLEQSTISVGSSDHP